MVSTFIFGICTTIPVSDGLFVYQVHVMSVSGPSLPYLILSLYSGQVCICFSPG